MPASYRLTLFAESFKILPVSEYVYFLHDYALSLFLPLRLLLDDVLSELDKKRQQYLIEAMKDIQVFITATDIDEDLRKKLPKGNTYFVDNGIVNIYNI